jgi:hypothetical protein
MSIEKSIADLATAINLLASAINHQASAPQRITPSPSVPAVMKPETEPAAPEAQQDPLPEEPSQAGPAKRGRGRPRKDEAAPAAPAEPAADVEPPAITRSVVAAAIVKSCAKSGVKEPLMAALAKNFKAKSLAEIPEEKYPEVYEFITTFEPPLSGDEDV